MILPTTPDGTYHGQPHPTDLTLFWSSFGNPFASIVGWQTNFGAWVSADTLQKINEHLNSERS